MSSASPYFPITLPNTSAFKGYHWCFVVVLALALHAFLLVSFKVSPPSNGAKQSGEQGIEIGLKKISPAAGPTKKSTPSPTPLAQAISTPPITKNKKVAKPALPVKKKAPVKKTLVAKKKVPVKKAPVKKAPTKKNSPVTKPASSTQASSNHTAVAKVNDSKSTQNSPVSPSVSRGSGSSSSVPTLGGGNPKAKIDYTRQLLAWLERNKRYPSAAKRRGQEDTIQLEFTIDANGQLLSHNIPQLSRYKSLNKAVEKMLRKSQPFPAVPSAMKASGTNRFTFTVPIVFTLRN